MKEQLEWLQESKNALVGRRDSKTNINKKKLVIYINK